MRRSAAERLRESGDRQAQARRVACARAEITTGQHAKMQSSIENTHCGATPETGASSLGLLARLYPEIQVAGFARNDQHVVFFTQVNALLEPHMTVLDFGAGRGSSAEWPIPFKRRLLDLKGKCAKVVGFDVDPAIYGNPQLDEAILGAVGEPLPFPDAHFDVIVSRATFEHIADPVACARELGRVLKPGGWLCAWTPSRWGIVGLGANLVPNRLHASVLRHLEPTRKDQDVFPTVYKMNTGAALRRLFPETAFRHATYAFSGPPSYHANRLWLARLWQLYELFMPPPARKMLHIFIQKR